MSSSSLVTSLPILPPGIKGRARADGFPVEVDGWDMAGTADDTSAMTKWEASDARSGYRVRLADGKWHDVPNSALIDPKTNKLGYAVVWLLPRTSLHIHCFLPGAGG